MAMLIAGLIVFLGVHLLRVFAGDWRARQIARLGEGAWKGVYSLVSIAGFVLIVYGYGEARGASPVLWTPPPWTHHAAIGLTVPAFVLLVAGYVPRNHLRQWFGHPMVAGAKLWAFAHLLNNGRLADVLLFGAFLAWAVLVFAAARRRDRRAGVHYARGTIAGDLVTLVLGGALWAGFAFWAHQAWIGVDPLVWIGL